MPYLNNNCKTENQKFKVWYSTVWGRSCTSTCVWRLPRALSFNNMSVLVDTLPVFHGNYVDIGLQTLNFPTISKKTLRIMPSKSFRVARTTQLGRADTQTTVNNPRTCKNSVFCTLFYPLKHPCVSLGCH